MRKKRDNPERGRKQSVSNFFIIRLHGKKRDNPERGRKQMKVLGLSLWKDSKK